MNKKIFILVVIIIIVAAVAAFILTREEDPGVKLAKEEVRQAEAALVSFQNVINAIPALELSQDVKNDFKMQAGYLGLMGYIEPGKEGISPIVMPRVLKFLGASQDRASAKLSFDLDKDFAKTLQDAILIADVTREDLGFLEKTANAFDEAIKQAKTGVPKLKDLTVERNKKTEKYFSEFERIEQKLKAAAASLDSYSSADFRTKIKKLKSASEVFGEVARYNFQLITGKAWLYSLNTVKTFPELVSEEAAVKNCAKYNPQAAPAGCEPVGFLPGKYQPLLIKLADIYDGLIE